jgi:hypothetical protein
MASRIRVEVVEEWPDSLVQALVPFYAELARKSVWLGRSDTTADFYRWKYADNPVKPAVGAFLFDQQDLVGGVIVSFKMLFVEGRETLVAELGNLLVLPRYRAFLTKLVLLAVERTRSAGAELIYSIPTKTAVSALKATDQFYSELRATHRTWVLPLRPLAVITAKYRLPGIVTLGDSVSRAAAGLLNGRLASPAETLLDIDARTPFVNSPDLNRMQLSYDAAYADYRISRHPAHTAYRQLPSNGYGCAVIRIASFQDQDIMALCRAEHAGMRGYARQVRRVARLALARKSAFVALWAPGRVAFSRILARHMFIPVQQKIIMVAKDCAAPHIVRNFGRWAIEMLDSDKA